jgi:DNA-directed RNA polymerase subunit D
MEIQIIEKTDFTMQLIIREVDTSYVNALRRTMLSEVPAMAIEDVVIIENSSVLHDEILAHRLGLVPLKTDLDSYNLPEECPCKSEFGCNLCRVALTLEAEATDETTVVYSKGLQSENPDVAPVSDKILIAKLAPGQKIKLEAYARLGKGKVHAKWQPVSTCSYDSEPQTKTDKNSHDTFVFSIESTGALPAERIVLEATKILDKRCQDFSKALKRMKR